ncbi:unannotated protein [freshwater metagenome]|uniref:Unannotated protein n=1 Tax=freshwater metagenome TaxID=449393 RepID=A0A6J6U0R1_9ZZZZ|nr:exo-alpha-sialidase [Actinomycetota bacterium]
MTRPRHAPGRRRARTAFLLAPLLALAACSEAPDAEPGQPLDVTHVHGLAVDPEDPQRVFVATHEGLGAWTEDGVERVSGSTADFMGFTIGPDGTLYGSGHPGRGEDGPSSLGLIRSDDGGRSWEPVSLAGEADFHALAADDDGVVGYDANTGQLRLSPDGEQWEDVDAPDGFLDLAADPASARFLGTTGQGVLVASEDGGRTFDPVPEAPRLLLVDFFSDGTTLGVAADGSLQTGLADGSWEDSGARAGEGLQAMAVGPDGTVWVLDGEGLRRSTDRGRTLESVPGW